MNFTQSFLTAVRCSLTLDRRVGYLRNIDTETELRHLGQYGLLSFPLTGDSEVFIPSIAGEVGVGFTIEDSTIRHSDNLIIPIIVDTRSNIVQKRSSEDLFKVFSLEHGNSSLHRYQTPGPHRYIATKGLLMDDRTANGTIYFISGHLYDREFLSPIANVIYINSEIIEDQGEDPMAKFIVRKLLPALTSSVTRVYDHFIGETLPNIVRIEPLGKFLYTPQPPKDVAFEESCRKCLLDNMDDIRKNLAE